MRTVDDLIADGVQDRFVLLRADFNVPLDGYTITDDGRIRAALPTITKLAAAGAKVLVMAHLGRPKGGEPPGRDPVSSLSPVAGRLGQLLDQRVSLAQDVVGLSARGVAEGLRSGGVALLANVRCDPRETGTEGERDQLARSWPSSCRAGRSSPTASASCTASRPRWSRSRASSRPTAATSSPARPRCCAG